jgi:glycosyltransferase involved in cell wall biosynthesis
MKVFMLGWEFPPHISGGLGTACHGLTRGLDEIGVNVSFVMPTAIPVEAQSHVQFRSPADLAARTGAAEPWAYEFRHLELHEVEAYLHPYGSPESHKAAVARLEDRTRAAGGARAEQQRFLKEALPAGTFAADSGGHYPGDLLGQVYRYGRLALELALHEEFDVIHAHDWMTFPAGMAVAAATRKPLVVQVHSTEFDRSGEHVNQQVYDIERAGMHSASRVVCVSYLTQKVVVSRYGVPPEKTAVVYNAVETPDAAQLEMNPIRQNEKIVLFLGRVTMQKGPEYFLMAARKVVEKYPNVRFIVAGSGDMTARCVQLTADLKLGSHVTFTGFLRGRDVDRVFSMADLFVMPSVSEPFGIAPLEALSHSVPVIISKQSGVSEVLTHVLKVDFWDTDEMANKILAVLRHAPLRRTLRQHGHIELRKFSWRDSARKLLGIYQQLVA